MQEDAEIISQEIAKLCKIFSKFLNKNMYHDGKNCSACLAKSFTAFTQAAKFIVETISDDKQRETFAKSLSEIHLNVFGDLYETH